MDKAQIEYIINQGKQNINRNIEALKERAIHKITQEKTQNYTNIINELKAISQKDANQYQNLKQQNIDNYNKAIDQIKNRYSLKKEKSIKKFNDELMKLKANDIKKIDEIYQIEKNRFDKINDLYIQNANENIDLFCSTMNKNFGKNANMEGKIIKLRQILKKKKQQYKSVTGRDFDYEIPNSVLIRAIYQKKKTIETLKKKLQNNGSRSRSPTKPSQNHNPSENLFMDYATKIHSNITKNKKVGKLNYHDTSINELCNEITYHCQIIYNNDLITQNKKIRMCPKKRQIQAMLILLNEIFNNADKKGGIAQVKTGEGKSFIIAIVSIILVKHKKLIDVVTSTTQLARRDEQDQRIYYELFKVTSGVLINSLSDTECEDEMQKTSSEHKFNIEVFDKQIVYSTNSNFEFVYLYSLFETKTIRKRKYDVVIVDEVDSMLIDQASSPAIISREVPVANFKDILTSVYLMKNYDVETIILSLIKIFPKYGDFNEKAISLLKDAALQSDYYKRDKDYVIQEGKVIILDGNTGMIKKGSRWKGFIHEMIELREGLEIQNPSNSYAHITQKCFFNLYHKIIGVTGTCGDENDRNILSRTYNVNIFNIPRNDKFLQKVCYYQRPKDTTQTFQLINYEINKCIHQNRPVLVIFNYKYQVDHFVKMFRPDAHIINGTDQTVDLNSIKSAGYPKVVTIATNAAGRGIDIKPNNESFRNGGLHVIIPFLPKNERILEQAKGRSARQGKPGSVSIYIDQKNDSFYKSQEFDKKYDNLFNIQKKFIKEIHKSYEFVFNYNKKYGIGMNPLPFKASIEYVLNSAGFTMSKINISSNLSDNQKANFIFDMIILAWAAFYSDITEDDNILNDKQKCDEAYNNFINLLHKWILPNKKLDIVFLYIITTAKDDNKTDLLTSVEELCHGIINAAGSVINGLTGGLLSDLLKNRIFSGSLSVIGGIIGLVSSIYMTFQTGGINLAFALAQCSFAANSIVDGFSNIVLGVQGDNKNESLNPIKKITSNLLGHDMSSTIDVLEFLIGMKSFNKPSIIETNFVEKVDQNLAKIPQIKKTKLTPNSPNVFGGFPINDATLELLMKNHGEDIIRKGYLGLKNELLAKRAKFKNIDKAIDAIDKGVSNAGNISTLLSDDDAPIIKGNIHDDKKDDDDDE